MGRIKLALATMVSGPLIAAGLSIAAPSPASALSGSEFQAGRIIDDSIFYDRSTMTIQQIQEFLTAKVPTCDTQGTQMRGSITRAQHGTNNGVPPPYTCLKDYRQNTVAKSAEAGLCNGYGVANHSAADIIYHVAQSCGVNPKVLLVLLQKEQSLITDDWPWPIQYRAATGYGCPDTAECDSQYYGFFNQVYSAARGFKYYAKHASQFNYLAGRNNNIQYNPSAACGSSSVFIQNQATAGLYNYTPYQPNTAALNNLYGTGDGCSAYGNRNFWRMFNDWFGSTRDNIPVSYSVRLTTPITVSPALPVAGEQVTVSYTIRNFDPNNPITMQSSVLQCRLMPSTNCDPAYNPPITLAANEQRVMTHTFSTMQTGGAYSLIPYFSTGGVWYRYGTDTPGGNVLHISLPGMRITSPITTSPATPVAGEPMTATYTVRNLGITPVVYQPAVLQCRLNGSTNCDPAYHAPTTIAPNESRTFSATLPALQAGTYTLTPYFQSNGNWYRYSPWQVSANASSLTVHDVRLVGNITSNPADPIPGQAATISYTARNYGTSDITFDTSVLQCRINTWTNCDPAYDSPVTLGADEQRTFTYNLPAVRAGAYDLVPYFYSNGSWFRFAKGTADSSAKRVDVPAYVANMQLTSPITASPANPLPGQTVTVSFTAKNTGTKPAIYQSSVLQCRRNTTVNCDPAYDAPLTIAADAERTFSVDFTAKAGSYTFTPFYSQNDAWHKYGLGTASANSLRLDVPAYVADLRLTEAISVGPAFPAEGSNLSVSYTVKNHGTQPAILQSGILQCRRYTSINCDPSYESPLTIAAGAEHTFSSSFPSIPRGTYVFTPYYMQNDSWYKFGQGAAPANSANLLIVP